MLMYGNSPFDLGRARGPPPMPNPQRGCIWTARDPASSKTPSPGLGEGGAPCHSDLRGQNPGFEHEPSYTCFCEKCEKVHPISPPRRHSKGAPLLQFWHHEVTVPRAKAKPKEGFQRDRGIPGHSKNHMNSYTFLTLTEKLFQAPIQKKDGVL